MSGKMKAPLLLIIGVFLLGTTAPACPLVPVTPQSHATLWLTYAPPGYEFPSEDELGAMTQRVADYYDEASYGAYQITGVDDPDAPGDLMNFQGGYTLTGCGTSSYVRSVLGSLTSAIDFSQYEQVVLISPGTNCFKFGIGMTLIGIPGTQIRIGATWVDATYLAIGDRVATHELGHVLTLDHAHSMDCPTATLVDSGCAWTEYGDPVDVMSHIPWMNHFGAFQKEKLGWLGEDTILEVTESGRYFISHYETRLAGYKALKIKRQANSYLYVEYRFPVGFDHNAIIGPEGGAVIRVSRPRVSWSHLPDRDRQYSYSLKTASGANVWMPGETFEDSRGHRITVVKVNAFGMVLDVEVADIEETDPPNVTSTSTTAAVVANQLIHVSASDPSGIDRVEFYRHTQPDPPLTNHFPTTVELVGVVEPEDGVDDTELEVEFETEKSTSLEFVEAVVYDNAGNASWLWHTQD